MRIALLLFAVLISTAWFTLHYTARLPIEVNTSRTFAVFVLLFAPLWFFAFGAAEPLKLLPARLKILFSAVLSLPYFVSVAGAQGFYWRAAVIVVALPILLTAFLELPRLPAKMTIRDAIVLAIIVVTYFEGWLRIAWPKLPLAPKLFLADIALYCFLVVRRLEGAGYSLIPSRKDFRIGLREWAFYFPIALILGELTGFIRFHPVVPTFDRALGFVLFTFFLIALPEEMFFRAILQNLLETRIGKLEALIMASVLFGLSHFNHGTVFNWRYVLLAGIAGFFYGRAWRAERRIFASLITHTAVDVVWALWFR